MVRRIWVPRWMYGRRSVRRLLTRSGVADSLRGTRVVVQAMYVARSTASAADELVKQIIADRDADEMIVVAGTAKFLLDLERAALRRDVTSRLDAVIDTDQLIERLEWRLRVKPDFRVGQH